MMGMFKRSAVLGVLAFGLVAYGCDTTTGPVSTGDQLQVETANGLLGQLLGAAKLELVKSTLSLTEEVVSAVIGPDGGVLEAAGHRLTVREGSVSEPTLFVMTVEPDYIVVDLQAMTPGLMEDVGGRGFEVPVQLALSYAGADVDDPSKLTIVHIKEDGTKEVIPSTVDTEAQVVRADLHHFSRYGLCQN